jgi:predicted O-methyltransferase YrrM
MRLSDIRRHAVTLMRVTVHRLRHGDKPLFTFDWTTPHCDRWVAAIGNRHPLEILEIGSFEGRSARFFLDTFPHARITCIDTYSPKRSAKFDHNVRPHRRRVTKLAGRSAAMLDRLAARGHRFDVVYIDGDHGRAAVLADSVLAWPLLGVGGVLIWDDYLWEADQPSPMRPQHAIDVFCQAFAPCFSELHRGYQIIIKKTGDWPITDRPSR